METKNFRQSKKRFESQDTQFRSRSRSNDRFHRRDFSQQSRSQHMKRGYQYPKNRGRPGYSFTYVEEINSRRFSPQASNNDRVHVDQKFNYQQRRSQSPVKRLEVCDDYKPFKFTYEHRIVKKEEFGNERRERSLSSDRFRNVGHNTFSVYQDRMLNMNNFRSSEQNVCSVTRSDITSTLFESSGPSTSSHVRVIKVNDYIDSGENRRSPKLNLSFSPGRNFGDRNISTSPSRFMGRRSESLSSIRSRSFERKFPQKSSYEIKSNSSFSSWSGGSLKKHEIKRSRKGSIRSRSPYSSHSRDFERDGLKHIDSRSYRRPEQSRIIERHDFQRDRSPSRCFSPARRQSPEFLVTKTRSFERHYFPRDRSPSRCFSPARRQSPEFFVKKNRSFERHDFPRDKSPSRCFSPARRQSGRERFKPQFNVQSFQHFKDYEKRS